MPLVTVTVRKGKSPAFKDAVLNAAHAALVAAGVPKEDRFHRVFEMDAADFRYDAKYPDLARGRSDDYVLIDIVLSVGRSVKVKKQIVQDIIAHTQRALPTLNADDIMVVFVETRWENWSFGAGRFLHA